MEGLLRLLWMVLCIFLSLQVANGNLIHEIELLEGIGESLENLVNSVEKSICVVAFSFFCPAEVAFAGEVFAGMTAGLGAVLLDVGVPIGEQWCRVQKHHCKRSADVDLSRYVLVPFSNKFSNFDLNDDDQMTFREFAMSIRTSIPIKDLDDLKEPFRYSDFNGDKVLDMKEFRAAPFIFHDVDSKDRVNGTHAKN